MIYYLILSFLTAIIVFLTYKIWEKTQELSFVIGFSILYYWTFYGCWFFIADELTNREAGKFLGLYYYYLLEKMFMVKIDNFYSKMLLLYGLFFVCLQVTVYYFVKTNIRKIDMTNFKKIEINHLFLFLISFFAIIISFYLERKEIFTAINKDISIYTITRSSNNPFYTLHKLLNIVGLAPLLFGFVIYLTGSTGKLFTGKKNIFIFFGYILMILISELYMTMLGNKHELLFAGLFCTSMYLLNVQYKYSWRTIISYILIIGVPLFFINKTRGYSLKEVLKHFKIQEKQMIPMDHHHEDDHEDDIISFNTTLSMLFNNEMFCASFSMYGALSKDIPKTYGSSFVSLAASVVPSIFWPNRPKDIYSYYANQVGAKKGQGYTIHHATGWYLNFGIIGIIIGAIVLGWIWAACYNLLSRISDPPTVLYKTIFILMANASLVAILPQIVRAGPEAYKTLIFEAFAMPMLTIYFSSQGFLHMMIHQIKSLTK